MLKNEIEKHQVKKEKKNLSELGLTYQTRTIRLI